jgi:threonine/homoserine/homoserine lactone efflux protein
MEPETLDILTLAGLAAGSFALALSGALVPGPTFFVTIAGVRRHGFWFGPLVVLGHAVAELLVVALLLWGLSAVLKDSYVRAGIGAVGAIALVWMGTGMIRQARRLREAATMADAEAGPADAPATAAQTGNRRTLLIEAVSAGFLTSIGNPFWHFWWVTQPLALLAIAAAQGWPGIAAFFIGHISADLAWLSVASLGVSSGRRFLKGRLYAGLLIGCGLMLFVMAGLFLKLAIELALGWAATTG